MGAVGARRGGERGAKERASQGGEGAVGGYLSGAVEAREYPMVELAIVIGPFALSMSGTPLYPS